jgi:hypothetical protein
MSYICFQQVLPPFEPDELCYPAAIMPPNSKNNRLEEYYVIRVERKITEQQSELANRDIFLGTDNKPVSIKEALRFDNVDQAEQHVDALPPQDRYRYVIQFYSWKRKNDNPDELGEFINRIMEIPYPYRRTAYNWLRGRDVEALLRRESDEVYQRHRKLLLDHDIDITRRSDIILMKPKRRKFNIDTSRSEGAPRQYFAYPDQRPLPLTGDDDDAAE